MSNEKKLKILLIGPVSVGKTTIANFLSDAAENFTEENRPTKGVRIVEFVVQGVRTKSFYQKTAEVELWDCSGDSRYSTCWPAMQHKMDGIIFVYTEPSNQQKAALNRFYDFFVEQPNFPEDCCIVMKNQLSEGNGDQILDNPLPGLSHAGINLQVKGGEFKKTFNSFVSTVMKFSSND